MNKLFTALLLCFLCLAPLVQLSAGATLPKTNTVPAQRPNWWLSQPAEGGFVCSYGIGMGATPEAAKTAAHTNALEDANIYVSQYANTLAQKFQLESGLVDPRLQSVMEKMVKSISSARFNDATDGLSDSRTFTDRGKIRYKTFLQVLIPKSAIEQSLVNNIRNEESLSKLFGQSSSYKAILNQIRD